MSKNTRVNKAISWNVLLQGDGLRIKILQALPWALVRSPTDMICYNVVSVTIWLDLPPGKWLDRHITPCKLTLLMFLGSDPGPMKPSFQQCQDVSLRYHSALSHKFPFQASHGAKQRLHMSCCLGSSPSACPSSRLIFLPFGLQCDWSTLILIRQSIAIFSSAK